LEWLRLAFIDLTVALAPSPRVQAYLARRARDVMALTTTDRPVHEFPLGATSKHPPPPVKPPAVALTPSGDIWPRPYYIENGLRRVAPYHYTYNTFCKQRWRNRTLLDIFSSEFRDRDRAYYKHAIESGHISINGKPKVDPQTVIKNGDVISHTLHRHEPPVTAQPIKTIHEDNDIVVIDKPAGVPVHPAGRYKFNSVIEIMQAERAYGFQALPCNRLDRLTSGVMFIGKNSKSAESMSEQLRSRSVRKEYVARVRGRFPDGENGIVKCEESILQISPILGLNRARASGKSAKTLFRRLAYYPPASIPPKPSSDSPEAATPAPPLPSTEDAGYSIIHCLPLTGRTHQIRVHLQFLGHPITNDPIYSNRRVFGPSLAQNDSSSDHDAEIISRLSNMGKTETFADALANPTATDLSSLINQTQQTTISDPRLASLLAADPSVSGKPHKGLATGTLHVGPLPPTPTANSDGSRENPMYTSSDPIYGAYVKAHDEQVADYNRRKGEKMTGEKCPECDTPLYSDPGPEELGIYLHAVAYSDLGGKWRYRSEMPAWGMPREGVDGPREVGEWVDSESGEEYMGVGDEREERERRNKGGMMRNKDME
jgi:tRNA pseudouridine32 synthase